MSRLARNVSANLLSNAWSTALSLVLTPVYLSFLGVESFGVIGLYTSFAALAGILDTGISATAVREIAWLAARQDERARIPSLLRSLEVIYWAILLPIGTALLVAVWWFGASWFSSASIPGDALRMAMALMVVALVVQIPSGLYSAALIGLQRQVRCAGLITVFGTVRGAGAAVVLAWLVSDVRAFFLWHLCVGVLQTGIMRRSAWRAVGCGSQPVRFSPAALHSVKRFAGGMTVLTALSLVITQADKIIISRLISLESFGLYMLAWTVASGLSRVATPLIQAFSPHFTELVSRGDSRALGTQIRRASQLTSVLILPPAALLVLWPEAILFAWTGNSSVAAGAAPLLAVMTVGTALTACSYPPLSMLFSRDRLRPVLALNIAAVVVLVPLVVIAATRSGPTGAALCWVLFGLVTYVAYLTLGVQGLPGTSTVDSMLRDFTAPALASLAVAAIAGQGLTAANGRLKTAAIVATALVVGWGAALVVCRDLYRIAAGMVRWR
jgi:O-antigen/teichoic acid export membrane protein